jgi:hypothetical protein
MPKVIRQPSSVLLSMAEAIDEMVDQYRMALRSAEFNQWEAPREGYVWGWLLVRNIQAVIALARQDEIMATAAWSNARVSFELSVRIIWMLQPTDRYEAECRWLAFLKEHEQAEVRIARESSADADARSRAAEAIRSFREGVIAALPSDYRPAKIPSLREMLRALDNSQMYQLYIIGSQFVHGSAYATTSYSRNLGNKRVVGDFSSIMDWILPMRLCWLSFREAAWFILDRLDVPELAKPDWKMLNNRVDTAYQALISSAVQSYKKDTEVLAESAIVPTVVKLEGGQAAGP